MKIRYLPQDPLVGGVREVTLKGSGGLANERMSVQDQASVARPDADGNFLYELGTPEFQQGNTFVAANRTLDMFEKAVGHKIPWAFQGDLKIHTHYGSGFNAFYLRQDHSLNFFDGVDQKTGKTIHGSESLDVISHETGHAILDGLRPGLMGWFGSGEAPAFHESFGDMTAILTSLQDDLVIERVCQETGGDLRKPNVAARLAEEMSQGINHTYLQSTRPESWVMRDANNDYLYVRPEGLPEKAPPEVLSPEPHSFSRIFTGAFWEMLSGVQERMLAQGQSPQQALRASRDVMASMLGHAVELGPNRLNRFHQMAQAFLKADERYFGGEYKDLLQDVLGSRNLISKAAPEVQAPRDISAAMALVHSSGGDPMPESVWKNDRGETFVRFDAIQEVQLDAHTTTDLAASLTLGIDSEGQVFHSLWEPVTDETVEAARQEVSLLRRREPAGSSDLERGYSAQPTRQGQKLSKLAVAY
ncbi:hypothetical protein JST97_06460 [bacterium]|nr:hypothetical protein [bacterium]